jgi:DNA polymerase-3 subunit gamma/tau
MLSTQAFNGLLKTLEEPPEHVKFIFATTEIRKVPVTVLSRCQRFDLRRIPASDLAGLFSTIAGKEGIEAETEALALIARAAEGSARDGLSLLDQAIAHGSGHVETSAVRAMLGLADRARIVDLFREIAKGDVAAALREFSSQYEAGANPVVVLTDLADFTHLVTRLKFIPESATDASLSEIERKEGAEFAGSIAVSTLSRIWQMLLKGIPETENSSRPLGAAEMVIIRLAHAGNLPAPEDAARRIAGLLSGEASAPSQAPRSNGSNTSADRPLTEARGIEQPASRLSGGPTAMLSTVPSSRPEARMEMQPSPKAEEKPEPKIVLKTLADIANIAGEKRDMVLKAQLRQFVRPVRMEPGKLEFALSPDAPKSIANDLFNRLKEWTGVTWQVSVVSGPGGLTLIETEAKQRDDRLTDARSDPDVAAILTQFPGARITDVRVNQADLDEEADVAPEPELPEDNE